MSGWIETPEQRAVRTQEWRRAFGEWLHGYEWAHWVTLTVPGRWAPERLKRTFDDEYVRLATKTAQGPVRYAYVIEGGALGDHPHLHALLHGTSALERRRLEEAWRHGKARAAVYNSERGAPYYLAKEIGGNAIDYGVSGRMPPRRTQTAGDRGGA